MRPRLVAVLGPVAVAALVAGCGSDDSSSAAEPTPTVTVTATATATATATVTATPSGAASTTASPAAQECPASEGGRVRVVVGQLDCDAAAAIAAGYDLDGEKRQEVQGYVCESGNAMTRPVVFTCTDRAGGRELVVEQP